MEFILRLEIICLRQKINYRINKLTFVNVQINFHIVNMFRKKILFLNIEKPQDYFNNTLKTTKKNTYEEQQLIL